MSATFPQWLTLPALSEYNDTLEIMQQRVFEVINGQKGEAVFLAEHSDVYTAGTNYKDSELIDCGNIPVVYTGRGGKFTYHGPGQRVIYPILNLAGNNRAKDLHLYVSFLEQLIINTLHKIGVDSYTIEGKIGIWVDIEEGSVPALAFGENISLLRQKNKIPAKIGAIGVRIKKWVTYHGASININTDLSKYKGIVPCGISQYPITSLAHIGIDISMNEFDHLLKQEFYKIF